METLLEKAEQQANKAITSAEKAWQAAQNAADAAQSASCTEGYINQIAEQTVQKAAADIEQKIQDAIELLQSQFKKANETVVSENIDDSVASENIKEQEELEEEFKMQQATKEQIDLLKLDIKEHFEYYKKKGFEEKEAMKMVAKDRKISKSDVYKEVK